MKTTHLLLLAASLSMSAGITTPAQAHGRVELEQSVIARADVVSVSDLLPADASLKLRARAAGVVVGDAPLPGTRRTFRRSELENALRGAAELRAALEIPDAIEVTRWSRPLSRLEILGVLQAAISAGQLSGGSGLTAADFGVIPAVLVTEESPKIEITRIEPALDNSETRIRMWIPSEPRIPPFWIVLNRSLHASPEVANRASAAGAAAAQRSSGPSASAGDSLAEDTPRAAFLIRAGQPVELVLLATGMRITTSATALERGREGQKIRVRSVLSGKLLQATVVNGQVVEVLY